MEVIIGNMEVIIGNWGFVYFSISHQHHLEGLVWVIMTILQIKVINGNRGFVYFATTHKEFKPNLCKHDDSTN